jgi:hypothetical protein
MTLALSAPADNARAPGTCSCSGAVDLQLCDQGYHFSCMFPSMGPRVVGCFRAVCNDMDLLVGAWLLLLHHCVCSLYLI